MITMCILIHKPKGIDFPSDDILNECWYNNPDGCGISWNDGSKTHLKKGFMSIDHLILYVDTIRNELIDNDVLIHFRYATHGSVKPANCHPFVVSNRIKDLQRVKYHGNDMIIAHNGVIGGSEYTRKTKNDLSDTMLFTKRLYAMGLENNEMQNILRSGKFCLMYPDRVIRYGNFVEDTDIYYSNTSYQPIVYKFSYANSYDNSYRYNKYRYNISKSKRVISKSKNIISKVRSNTDTSILENIPIPNTSNIINDDTTNNIVYFPDGTYGDDIPCQYEDKCLKSGICVYTGCDIEEEMYYGDPNFCPLCADFKDVMNNDNVGKENLKEIMSEIFLP